MSFIVTSGGRERTETEFRTLFEAAGFKLTNIIPTQSLMSVIEGVRASAHQAGENLEKPGTLIT